MENPLTRFLDAQPFVVLDGAMATELEALGADLNDPLWSAKVLVEAPDLIRQVHFNYLQAGADILSTATYQATYAGFANRKIDQVAAYSLFAESVRLATSARKEFWENEQNRAGRIFPLIAASLGPYGAYLADGSEYHGNYGLTLSQLKAWHEPQVKTLVEMEDVDFLLFETIPSSLEAQAIISLMEGFPSVPYGLSFSCKNGTSLSHGETFAEMVEVTSKVPQIIAVGINCTAPEFIGPLLKSVKQVEPQPLMAYPNSGEIWNAGAHCWKMRKDHINILELLTDWYRLGARIIGGCCRTTPSEIAGIRKLVKSLESPE